ncbi:hypothetical protein [Mesorhizobium sp.]|uniref:hypothetical protein n=1 Tax=Mesorhizobium sp. TaxID=1871066 RepID=UPI000FE61C15|nr:hypothetical protein [Mesorhizobium sp.]RWB67598.1 MAG: hypothetical protein EOQ49_25090 [Mesorhizobium sp.]
MADHINIHAPRDRYDLRAEIELAHMKAEMALLQQRYDKMESDLDSIFTRIARGDQVELHYPNGEIVLITKARKRGEKEGGE